MNEELDLIDVFTIGDNTFPNNLKEHLAVRNVPINDAFMDHAELFAWYATAYELAVDHESRLKVELKRKYALLDHKHRQDGKMAGVKMTEKMVENTVITDPSYVQLENDYLSAQRNSGLLKAARDAMLQRRDMLIQLGATYRAEGASDISLREMAAEKYIKEQ